MCLEGRKVRKEIVSDILELWKNKIEADFLQCLWLKNKLKAKKSDAEIVLWEIKKKEKNWQKNGKTEGQTDRDSLMEN